MKEENLDRLNSLFTNLKMKDENDSQRNRKSEEDLFIEGFIALCKNSIEIKMQEFRRMLRENGYGCKITFTEESKSGLGINSHPNIKLQISRNVDSNFYSNYKFPHIMFIADKNYKKINIHQDTIFQNGTGNTGMKPRTYTLETLDEESIEKEILESIENILLNK